MLSTHCFLLFSIFSHPNEEEGQQEGMSQYNPIWRKWKPFRRLSLGRGQDDAAQQQHHDGSVTSASQHGREYQEQEEEHHTYDIQPCYIDKTGRVVTIPQPCYFDKTGRMVPISHT